MNNKKAGLVIGFIALAGISFYAGNKYAEAKRPMVAGAFNGGMRGVNGGGGVRGMRGGFTTGEILSKDAQSITVKMQDGGSKIVFYTDKTTVSKMISGAISDLAVGNQVVIMGNANPDGSLNADSVQIRTSPMKLITN
jgi:hypothetical protein